MKKLSKILTFILALAMALSTVAMAEVITPPANVPPANSDTYTITAGAFANGTMTLKYGSNQTPLTSGSSVTIAKNTEVTVELDASGGYEAVKMLRAEEKTAGIKIIAVTSFALSEEKEKILATDFCGVCCI